MNFYTHQVTTRRAIFHGIHGIPQIVQVILLRCICKGGKVDTKGGFFGNGEILSAISEPTEIK